MRRVLQTLITLDFGASALTIGRDLYGARVVYKATSFCSLREGRMLEYRADSLHDALGGRAHFPRPCTLGGEVDATTSIRILG